MGYARILLVSMIVALGACEMPKVAIFWIDTREEPTFDRIEEACAWWGIRCYETDDDRGAVTVMLEDECATRISDGAELCGEHFDHAPCSPMVFAADADLILEHELGHVFALSHVDARENLMWWDGDRGNWTTARQERIVESHARLLGTCRRPT